MPRISFVPVPLSVSLLCDDLTAVLCWESHAQEQTPGPRQLHDVDGVCRDADRVVAQPYCTVVYLLPAQSRYPERPAY